MDQNFSITGAPLETAANASHITAWLSPPFGSKHSGPAQPPHPQQFCFFRVGPGNMSFQLLEER